MFLEFELEEKNLKKNKELDQAKFIITRRFNEFKNKNKQRDIEIQFTHFQKLNNIILSRLIKHKNQEYFLFKKLLGLYAVNVSCKIHIT